MSDSQPTDRQLLEWAAKAAGIVGVWDERWGCLAISAVPGATHWNPLTDDGDALRLAVTLGLFNERYALLNKFWNPAIEDIHARCRDAITRAAAALGKEPPQC